MKTLLMAGVLVAAMVAVGGAQTDPSARSRAATAAMNAGRYDEAAAIYRELLKGLPDEPGLLMNLGMALAMGGHEAEAIGPLERATALDPKLLAAQLFLGSSHIARGEPARAVAPLTAAVKLKPADIEARRMLAQALSMTGRTVEAVAELRRITELAPRAPAAWHALGHAYNQLTQDAMATFDQAAADAPWRQLLLADALFADGRLTDAFALYRTALTDLPQMATIHDAIADIYVKSGHADWAAAERKAGVLPPAACVKRRMLCDFRAGRYRATLAASLEGRDPESRYWRVRAATALSRSAFGQLDALPDSRERREVRAALARDQRRFTDAVTELQAALKFAPRDPGLIDDLGTAYYFAREYEKALQTLQPLAESPAADARLLTVYGDALLQLQRTDEAVAVLRRAVQREPDAGVARLTLGRAYLQQGDFAAAIPLIESQLADDQDGSLHAQLARAYTGAGQRDKGAALMAKSQEIQQAAQARSAAVAQRAITPPK